MSQEERLRCVVCQDDLDQGELIKLSCWDHWVCKEDIAQYFKIASEDESLYPPKCCKEILLLEHYEQHISADIKEAFLKKAEGEYQIMKSFRVYCAQPDCGLFLSPFGHIKDAAGFSYAVCEGIDCGKVTCVTCGTLLADGIEGHTCQFPESHLQFKEMAKEQGYQECANCGHTVELAEACNHISCPCGHEFCYICGRNWTGTHACPRYGRERYDPEGYGRAGFHRDTGLNREGLTYQQVRDQAGDETDDDEEREQRDEDMPDWDVLQHLDAAERAVINLIPFDEREGALEVIRIELMETRGIFFGRNNNANDGDETDSEDGDEDDDEETGDDDDDDDNSEEEDGEEDENAEEGEVNNANTNEGGETNTNENYLDEQGDIVIGEDAIIWLAHTFVESHGELPPSSNGSGVNDQEPNEGSTSITGENLNGSGDGLRESSGSIVARAVHVVHTHRVESVHGVVEGVNESSAVEGGHASGHAEGQ